MMFWQLHCPCVPRGPARVLPGAMAWYRLTFMGLWEPGCVQSSSQVTGGYWEPQPSLVEGLPIQTKS